MTRDEGINTTQYSMALWHREQRLFARLHRLIQSVQLASGLAAIGTLAHHAPAWLSATAGALIAITVVIDFVFRPAEAAARARDSLAHWSALHTKIHDVPEKQIGPMVREAQQRLECTQNALRFVAYNDMLDERGYPEGHYDLSLWQRLLKQLS